MNPFMKKLYRVFAGPQIGDIYVRDRLQQNPFAEEDRYYVEIIDKKQGWIQYKSVQFSKTNVAEWEAKMFTRNFTYFS